MIPDPLAANALPFQCHPDREAALKEAHARPYLPIHPPAAIHHLAFRTATPADRAALYAAVYDEPGATAAPHTIREDGDLIVRLEPHTEFATVTLISAAGPEPGFERIGRIAERMPGAGELLVALRLDVTGTVGPAGDEIIGGILRGEQSVATTFRPSPDGYVLFELAGAGVGAAQTGRRVQRLLEAETYRTLALLGLPVARRYAPVLDALEADLAKVTAALARGSSDSDEAILDQLQDLSARTEAMRADTRFRFAASRAYAALVEERLQSLMESKLAERPTLSGFIQASLAPAVRTIESTERRQNELSTAIGRALDVLRTRVDVSMERANQEIMRTMNERQHRQLILSEAVEGLSVIAISYYLVGLLAYPVRALKAAGLLPVHEYLVLGVLAPVVAAGVYTLLRRLKARWHSRGE